MDRSSEVSDVEFRRKVQIKLLLISRRVLANSIGRGMLTLGSLIPAAAEPLPFPELVLIGRLPTNITVTLDQSSATPDLTLWPQFHNG